MPDPLRLFILAGEPSGDRLAADLQSAKAAEQAARDGLAAYVANLEI